ncbi:hypothetical protein Patl1_23715 [Pistacia atlantica]|uniref:Uncharacterized protein n=1 Tax=Pistacia atlantica TaxID=434234 RepID=A0ACC0ZVJ1_9ROSI|nr:hypothetical protein Patl1_23715 [Pistacia atlantica]
MLRGCLGVTIKWPIVATKFSASSTSSSKEVAILKTRALKGILFVASRELVSALAPHMRTRVDAAENPSLLVGDCKEQSASMVPMHVSLRVAMLQELVDGMEAELNVSKVELVERTEAMVAKVKEFEDIQEDLKAEKSTFQSQQGYYQMVFTDPPQGYFEVWAFTPSYQVVGVGAPLSLSYGDVALLGVLAPKLHLYHRLKQ